MKEYEICSVSGRLGPKRKQGDGQIPEGFYTISGFNPASNFYLSLRVSYPNKSDEIRGRKGRLGGDIFVHGDCVTIGCLPMTDEMIKQIYLIAVEAKNEGQNSIPIHIFPTRLDDEALKGLGSKNDGITLWDTIMRRLGLRKKPDAELIDFWLELKPAYEFFEVSKKMPIIKIESDGRYAVEVPKY